MNNVIQPALPGIVGVQTAPRPTPSPVRVRFSDVLSASARTLVQGAQTVMSVLPGSPLVALALRGTGSGVPSMNVLDATAPVTAHPGIASSTNPEGPTAPPGGTSSALGSGGTGDGSVEGAIAQQQQMSMYYLQIQEEVNAQNRTFSALSNVLEVEHNTAKTAIGNIH